MGELLLISCPLFKTLGDFITTVTEKKYCSPKYSNNQIVA
jgi:hypothetical protein